MIPEHASLLQHGNLWGQGIDCLPDTQIFLSQCRKCGLSSASNLPTMALTPSQFATSYDKYQSAMNSFDANSNSTEVKLQYWKSEMPRIVAQCTDGAGFCARVLAVGTGNGKPFDISLLDMLSCTLSRVEYTVVEPRAEAVEEFKNLAETKYQNVQFHWFRGTFQDYQEKDWPKERKQFHLIHFVACLNYVGNSYEELKARVVPCCEEMLKENGALVILRLNQSQVKLLYPHEPRNPDVFALPNLVAKLAGEGGWQHESFDVISRVNLTPCFDEDSEEGALMLEFFTRVPNFRHTDAEETVQRTLEHLKSICHTMEDGSQVLTNFMCELGVIWKKVYIS